jgi:hypothetical protein
VLLAPGAGERRVEGERREVTCAVPGGEQLDGALGLTMVTTAG